MSMCQAGSGIYECACVCVCVIIMIKKNTPYAVV